MKPSDLDLRKIGRVRVALHRAKAAAALATEAEIRCPCARHREAMLAAIRRLNDAAETWGRLDGIVEAVAGFGEAVKERPGPRLRVVASNGVTR